MCGSTQHKLTACPRNKSCFHYDPSYAGPDHAGGQPDAGMYLADAVDPFGHMYQQDEEPDAEMHMVVDSATQAPLPPGTPPLPPHLMHPGVTRPRVRTAPLVVPRPRVPTAPTPARPTAQWTLDGGASHHFCGDITQMFDVKWDSVPVYVNIANRQSMQRAAVGKVRFTTCVDGRTVTGVLPEVWYMPGISRNLLSANQLKQAGNWRMGGKEGDLGEWWFTNVGNVPWLYCPFHNGLNVVDWTVQVNPRPASPYDGIEALFVQSVPDGYSPNAFVTEPNRSTDPESADLWHQRLGHVNCRTLSDLVRHNKLRGISVSPAALAKASRACEVCVLAKHARAPHPPRESAPQRPNEEVHSDISGPYPVRSLGGNVYVVTLLCGFTDYGDVEFLKTKDDASAALKRLIAQWEAKSGFKVKKLFTDRGGEYIDADFNQWLLDRGIVHEYSVPRTPQQNGKAERLNRTLNNMVRAMLLQYNSYPPLWSFAMKYAAIIRNVAMHSRLNITPYEAFMQCVPDVSEFRTFGCKVYALANRSADSASSRVGKLDARSLVGIYLGPSTEGPGCLVLIYNPQLKRQQRYCVYTCRDVVTYEHLPAVTGAPNAAALHWGGDIPLPTPLQLPRPVEQPESLTGGPPAPAEVPDLLPLPALGPVPNRSPAAATQPMYLPEPGAPSVTGRITRSMVRAGDVPPVSSVSADVRQVPAGVTTSPCPPSGLPSPASQFPSPPGPVSRPGLESRPAGPLQMPPLAPARDVSGDVGPGAAPVSGAALPHPPGLVPGAASRSRPKPGDPLLRLHEAYGDLADGYAHDPKRARLLPAGTPHSPRACAFLSVAPYPPPPAKEVPSKARLVDGLLRHFRVPDRQGDVPRLAEAAKLPVPQTLTEAMQSPFARQWAEATVDEWCSLLSNDTWTLVSKQPWMKIIPCRWVFVLKTDEHGRPVRFKARLVAGGHRQVAGVDYEETFAPVARLTSLRMFFAVAAYRQWKVHQIDITTAFLNGDIDVDVYMMQPPGFVDGHDQVVHLQKCLYGLKQAPKAWYDKLAGCLESLGMEPCSADSSLWIAKDAANPVFLATVVDDMLVTSPSEAFTMRIIRSILAIFAGKHMGLASHYNGMRIVWLESGSQCLLLQTAHIEKMVKEFSHVADFGTPHNLPVKPGLKLSKSGTSEEPDSPLLDVHVYLFRVLLGILLYLACGTRPDIAYIVNQLSRYANSPTVAHWKVAVGVGCYLVHTKYWGILLGATGAPDATYIKVAPSSAPAKSSAPAVAAAGTGLPPLPKGVECVAYADANHGTGLDHLRSVTGTVLQVLGGPVSWSSHVQPTQSVSTVDSEVYAMSAACREALWVAKLADRFSLAARPFLVRADSHGAICAVTKYTYTKHTKHIGIHQDFMRDRYQLGDLDFQHIRGADNPADIFTKALPQPAFFKHRAAIGMIELPEALR